MVKLHFVPFSLILCALALGRSPVSGIVFTNSALIAAGDTTYDGQDIVVNHCVLTVNGTHAFNSLQAISGGLVTHAGGDTNNRMYLTVSQNVYVDPASAIDASGMGFGTSGGPGGGTNSGTAGGYGGYGGGYGSAAGGVTYGSMSAPTDLGSGGGGGYMSAGGNGGGAVRLTVGGTLQVDEMLAASGVESPGDYKMGGGGSGGSVYLAVGTLAGSGAIRAEGGVGHGQGAGGGGRIAIYAGTYNLSGAASARGGVGVQNGGAGTVFTKLNAQAVGSLVVDNGTNWGQATPVSAPVSLQLTLSNCATVCPQGAMTVSALHLATNTVLTCLNGQTGLVLTVLGDALVDRGSAITMDGIGFGSMSGPGGATNAGAAGSYGGQGGGYGSGSAGSTYGSITAPVDPGSGGGPGYMSSGGSGGGVIRLWVVGALQLNGNLKANGVASGGDYAMGGAGSGGSIYVTASSFSGTGLISAQGGSGAQGGGGGGRVAVYSLNEPIFTGTCSAAGGTGGDAGRNGQNGTVYLGPGVAAISGAVTTTNGWPVRGLTLQTLDASASTTTDTNGIYTLLVAPGWSGTVQPQLAGASFLPATRNYSALSANQAGQDYSLLNGIQPRSTVTGHTSTLSMTWPTIPGLHYQVKRSDDLKTWLDYNAPQTGTGGMLTNLFDTHSALHSFFRVVVSS